MINISSIEKQKVYIYLDHFQEYNIQKIWNNQQYNPGIGGTEFQQLRLMTELQKRYEHILDINALIDNQIEYTFPNGVKTASLNSVCSNKNNKDSILIINSGGCEDNFLLIKKTKFKKILFWIHHPFDKTKCSLAKKLNAQIISCGLFQYFSNSIYIGRHSYINNFFYEENILQASLEKCIDENIIKKSNTQINIGFLGNLIASKSFHILAEYWNEIYHSLKAMGFSPKLIVIGGQINPTSNEISPKLNIEKDYERRILKLFKSDMKIPPNVYFTGAVDNPYCYATNLDLCVVNPLGVGEAASQTILELYSLSIPVVTSTKYGMCDYTDHINELAVPIKSKLSENIINWFKKSESDKKKIINKQLALAHVYSECISYSSAKWYSLIIDDSKNKLNFSPIPKFKSLLQIPYLFIFSQKSKIKRIIKYLKKIIDNVT